MGYLRLVKNNINTHAIATQPAATAKEVIKIEGFLLGYLSGKLLRAL